jgi:molybdate transport system substrate-binding protein
LADVSEAAADAVGAPVAASSTSPSPSISPSATLTTTVTHGVTLHSGQYASVFYRADDSAGGSATVDLVVTTRGGTVVRRLVTGRTVPVGATQKWRGRLRLRRGRYLLVAHAVDASGQAEASAQTAELRVLAPNAAKEAVTAAAGLLEKATGNKVILSWGGSEAIAQRVGGGEITDVVVSTASAIDRLIADKKLVQGTRTDFAKSLIGVAVAANAARPDISSVEGVKAALLAAKSIAISSGPSGRAVSDLFTRLGVSEQIARRIKQPPSGAQIADLLRGGEAELGFQQVSEFLHAKGIQYLGPLPAEIQSATVWSAAIHGASSQLEMADLFVRALRRSETIEAIKASGMEPLLQPNRAR